MGVNFEFTSNKKDEVINEKDKAVERALEAIGIQAEAYVSQLAPVDTGRLRDSIVYATSKKTGSVRGKATAADGQPRSTPEDDAVYIGTNVEYAAYVEKGTSKTKAQPYLKPALSSHVDEFRRIAESYLKG